MVTSAQRSTRARRNAAAPLLVGASARGLERLALGRGGGGEAWLQELIDNHPEILPVGKIEPGVVKPTGQAMMNPLSVLRSGLARSRMPSWIAFHAGPVRGGTRT